MGRRRGRGGVDEAVEITMPLKGICNRKKGEVTTATEWRRDLTFG